MNPLTRHRKAANMTQYDLADSTLVSQARISRIERGKSKPSPVEASRLAAFFGVAATRLFPDGAKTQADYPRTGDWDRLHLSGETHRPEPRVPELTHCPKCGAERVFNTTCYQCEAAFCDDAVGSEASV